MKKRDRRQDRIRRIMDDWGHYRRTRAEIIGWNVSPMNYESEIPHGTQKRNDIHPNPVEAETIRLDSEQRHNERVDIAVSELRPRYLRRLIIARHVRWPNATDTELARRMRRDRRHISLMLIIAYDQIAETFDSIQLSRKTA